MISELNEISRNKTTARDIQQEIGRSYSFETFLMYLQQVSWIIYKPNFSVKISDLFQYQKSRIYEKCL